MPQSPRTQHTTVGEERTHTQPPGALGHVCPPATWQRKSRWVAGQADEAPRAGGGGRLLLPADHGRSASPPHTWASVATREGQGQPGWCACRVLMCEVL